MQKVVRFIVLITALVGVYGSIPGFIDDADKNRFLYGVTGCLGELYKTGDTAGAYHSVRAYKLLNIPMVQKIELDTCAYLNSKKPDDKVGPELTFQILWAYDKLGCGKRPQFDDSIITDQTAKNLKAALENEKATTVEIRFALEGLSFLREKIPTPEKVATKLQARLKEDDSLQNLGQILHAASFLGPAGKFALQLIEDIVVQADEIDGRLLQWEGGLTSTSLLLTGLLRLPGAQPITQAQADKFAAYLLSRRSVQIPKGICGLVDAAFALAESKVSPVCVSVIGPALVTTDKPELKVRVSDLVGATLKASIGPVVAQSATRVTDDVVVLSKQPLAPGTQPTEFILPLKLEPGRYRLAISVGTQSSTLSVKVLGNVNLQWLEIGISDVDQSSAAKLTRLAQPAKLSSPLQADSAQHLIVRFSLTRTVHQAFIRLFTKKTEILFVAEIDSGKTYKVDVDLASELGRSAEFEIELILGDAIMNNPLRWTIGSVELKLQNNVVLLDKQIRGTKPEIQHQFRPAENRPPQAVSMLFTVLCATPLLLLLGLWLKLGINLRNFSFSLGTIGFHTGLTSIMGLFTLFWLKLDMFTTCGWLIVLGAFTFISGHRLLSQLAEKRKKA